MSEPLVPLCCMLARLPCATARSAPGQLSSVNAANLMHPCRDAEHAQRCIAQLALPASTLRVGQDAAAGILAAIGAVAP